MPGTAFYEPRVPWHGIVWRLVVSPLPALVTLVLVGRSQLGGYEVTGAAELALIVWPLPSFAALVSGWPLYAFYRSRQWTRWWLYVLGAAAVGAFFAIIFLASVGPHPGDYQSYSDAGGRCDAVINGVFTACGRAGLATVTACIAGFGGVSGLTFWALLRWRRRRTVATPDPGIATEDPAT